MRDYHPCGCTTPECPLYRAVLKARDMSAEKAARSEWLDHVIARQRLLDALEEIGNAQDAA